jgi:hypothetical protein
MVKLIGEPPHAPFSDTTIVPVIAEPVVFVAAVKSPIVFDPLGPRPIAVLLFVHVTPAPVFTLNAPTLIVSPGHTTMFGF